MLTNTQDQLLIGAILGDSHVERNKLLHYRRDYNCRVRFDHATRQRKYVCWKQKMLFPHAGKLTELQVVDKRTKKTYYKIRFNTLTSAFFNKYHDLFYRDRVKCVPANIEQLLVSDLALAVWYLDDGSLRTDCKGFRLHTNNYPLDGVVLLQHALLSNYGITSRIQKQDASKSQQERGFLLSIGSSYGQAEKFSAIIKPFVAATLPSMLYKFF